MGGASRFIMLLTSPFSSPFSHPRRRCLSLCISCHSHISRPQFHFLDDCRLHHSTSSSTFLSRSPQLLLSKSKSSRTHLHIQSRLKAQDDAHSSNFIASGLCASHAWPEFAKLLELIPRLLQSASVGSFDNSSDDTFVSSEKISDEFLSAARSCLAFARMQPDLLGSLPREDMEVVVTNGYPFLFHSASESSRRMRAYLAGDGSTAPKFDKAQAVDLMKYLLSYASTLTVSEPDKLHASNAITLSCRNLLNEVAEMAFQLSRSGLPSSEHNQFSGGYRQRKFGQNIEMKRGDWICPKCSFMNFARNFKCLECEEARPRRQLTGREWECRQCSFFNYGKNMVCLRCDSKRPGESSFDAFSSRSVLDNGDHSNIPVVENGLGSDEGDAQLWFSKVSQLNRATDSSSAPTDEDIQLRLKMTSVDRRMSNDSHYQRNFSNAVTFDGNNFQTGSGKSQGFVQHRSSLTEAEDSCKSIGQNFGTGGANAEVHASSKHEEKEQPEKSERWFEKIAELHDVKDLSSINSNDFPDAMQIRQGENRFVVSKKKDRSLTSPIYKRQMAMDQANNNSYVPFVPFPPNYFAKEERPQQVEPASLASQSMTETTSSAKPGLDDTEAVQRMENKQIHKVRPNSDSFESKGMSTNSVQNVDSPSSNFSNKASSSGTTLSNQNADHAWSKKSLEGSAVKEPDPLDMSEEAKAERWFRRVAQIKDISELSQIPDEDFPSIMPMRKGVNRFVVSKRKTPLERRLTSPQHRRNLPIMTSDPTKKENDDS